MKRKDWVIVAGILTVALIAGLVLVEYALRQARQTQQESTLAAQAAAAWAQASGSGAASSSEAAAASGSAAVSASGSAAEAGTSGSEGGASASGTGASASGSASGSAGNTGTAAAASAASAQSASAPSLGTGSYTLSQLTAWMQTESGGALAADSQMAAEKALAAGTGTGDDPDRRTFAKTQWEANDEARRNLLEEQAVQLGTEYLRCRDLLALQKENESFCRRLSDEAQAALKADDGADTGRTALLKKDAEAAAAALEEAALSLASAQNDLQSAIGSLNAAVGNDAAAALSVTGTLTRDALPGDTAEAAVSQALKNRNEIRAADYTASREKQALTKLRYQYPTTAPEYLAQQSAAQSAQTAAAQSRTEVENDVRTRYAGLTQSAQGLDLTEKKLKKAGTTAPTAAYAVSGDASALSSNLDALTGQWAEILSLRQQQINAAAQLNLDILACRHAVSVGCTAAAI